MRGSPLLAVMRMVTGGSMTRDDVAEPRWFGRTSAVRAYWLARCEGFRLEVDRTKGVVEDVWLDPTRNEAYALVVRVGRLGRHVVVAADEVEAVAPFAERLVGENAPSSTRATKASTIGRLARAVVAVAAYAGPRLRIPCSRHEPPPASGVGRPLATP
jgi:hypothetical protein